MVFRVKHRNVIDQTTLECIGFETNPEINGVWSVLAAGRSGVVHAVHPWSEVPIRRPDNERPALRGRSAPICGHMVQFWAPPLLICRPLWVLLQGHIFRKFQITNHAWILGSLLHFWPLKIVISRFPFPSFILTIEITFPTWKGIPESLFSHLQMGIGIWELFCTKNVAQD